MFACLGNKPNVVGVEPAGASGAETLDGAAKGTSGAHVGDHEADESGLLFKEASEPTAVSDIFGAVKQGDLETFTNILNKLSSPEEQVALLNTRGMWGSTLLIFAIQYGHKQLAHNILDRDEIDTHAVNEKGASAFLYACLDNHTDLVQSLIKYKSSHRSFKKESGVKERPAKVYNAAIDSTGLWTPLAASVANGNMELFDILVRSGAGGVEKAINKVFEYSILVPTQEDKLAPVKNLNPVMIAAAYGHVDLLKKLLEDEEYAPHINLQYTDSTKASVLHHAIRGKDPARCMALLLKQDALSPSALAQISSKSVSAKKLTQAMISQTDELGYIAAHYLMCRNTAYPEVLSKMGEELSDLGALDMATTGMAPKGKDQPPSLAKHPVGSTMLHIAVTKRHTDCVKVLIDAGANPTTSSGGPDGSRTPLELAKKSRSNQNSDMISILEEAIDSYQKNLTASGRTDAEIEEIESIEDIEKAIDEEDKRRGRLELRQPQKVSSS